jgi:hypothetical protein
VGGGSALTFSAALKLTVLRCRGTSANITATWPPFDVQQGRELKRPQVISATFRTHCRSVVATAITNGNDANDGSEGRRNMRMRDG